MEHTHQLASVTTRRFPLPPPAPRVRIDSARQQAAARRLVHAAIFASSMGEVNLKSAPETQSASSAVPQSAARAQPTSRSTTTAPLVQPVSSASFYNQGPATQSGILRMRPSNELIGTQGDGAARLKKKVRLKSPAAPVRGALPEAVGEKDSARGPVTGTSLAGNADHQKLTVEVQPPSSGAHSGADETGRVEVWQDLSLGAIQRCIPSPYRHCQDFPPSAANPDRQHPAKIRHSFVDLTLPNSVLSSSTKSSNKSPSYLRAFANLAPGRRGSWIIPISAALPIAHASSPTWTTASPGSGTLAVPRSKRKGVIRKSRSIEWTDARLAACWAVLTGLHQRSSMGEVKAACHLSSPERPFPASPSPTVNSSPWPDHIRVSADAHLALPLRSLFSVIAGKLSGREDSLEDAVKFLDGVELLWVDEAGRPILTA